MDPGAPAHAMVSMRKRCTFLFITIGLTAPSSADSCRVVREGGLATAASRLFVLLILGALLFSTSGGAAVTAPIPDLANCIQPPQGMVSWWRGEDNATDSAGNNLIERNQISTVRRLKSEL